MIGLLTVLLLLAGPTTDAGDGWETAYELSGCTRTPRYDETIAYCRRLADASPWIHYTTFGESPRGRPLPLLILDRDGHFSPETVREGDHAVVLIQAGIHAGEIDGKDAGLMLLRDIAIRRTREQLADGVTILFIPIFNVDGHERFGPSNRVNQNGPEEMGWRVTANNLNLNRDYLKLDTPEMRAWTKLFVSWLPEFFVDCHVTDGADYQYVLTYGLEIWENIDAHIASWTQDAYTPAVTQAMSESGFPICPYVWPRFQHDPFRGIRSLAATPRFSEGYTALHNRPGLLIETHMLKDYRARVSATYEMLRHTIDFLGRDRERLRRIVSDADRFAAGAEFRSRSFPLELETSYTDSTTIDFLGIDYEVLQSEVTGGQWYRYTGEPVERRISYYETQKVVAEAMLPEAYVIPVEWSDVIERLELNGARVFRLPQSLTLDVEVYRFDKPVWESVPFEGRHRVTFNMTSEDARITFPAGSAVLDMNQRAARVVASALEPKGADSYLSWGFFDAVFEQKEYVESYVIEQIARDMLADDPAVRDAFEAEKRNDPTFATDPERIRHWFFVRTPYYDDTIGRYPVARVVDSSVASRLRALPQRAAE